ncbi:MAG: hypothetical protein DCC65_14015 [Planctomycetota bacterium]|nr:MAG: hypothetical protein DCC65_14015 [Planctomycetota bacterium]
MSVPAATSRLRRGNRLRGVSRARDLRNGCRRVRLFNGGSMRRAILVFSGICSPAALDAMSVESIRWGVT